MSNEWFTTRQLVTCSGLSSKSMVDYLCRIGVLVPSLSKVRRRGISRRFSYTDLLLARSVAALLRSGVSVEGLRGVFKTLRTKLGTGPVKGLSKKHVVIIGKRVYLQQTPAGIIDLTGDGQLAFHFVLDVSGLADRPSIGSGALFRSKRRAA